MCMSFHVDKNALLYLITKARKKQISHDICVNYGKSLAMYGDLFPKDVAAVLAPDRNGKLSVFPMIWGFTHEAAKAPLINCRAETADSRDMWKESWLKRRCIIPVSWYYEWGYPVYDEFNRTVHENKKTRKVKFAIQPQGTEVAYIAGLYRYEERNGMKMPVFSILTRASAGAVNDIHDRMPVILSKDDLQDWIRPDRDPALIIKKSVTDMVMEKAVEYHQPVLDFIIV